MCAAIVTANSDVQMQPRSHFTDYTPVVTPYLITEITERESVTP
jgi:hypothetical protein